MMNKPFLNLVVCSFKFYYILPDGNGEKKECSGCESPLIILAAFLRQHGLDGAYVREAGLCDGLNRVHNSGISCDHWQSSCQIKL